MSKKNKIKKLKKELKEVGRELQIFKRLLRETQILANSYIDKHIIEKNKSIVLDNSPNEDREMHLTTDENYFKGQLLELINSCPYKDNNMESFIDKMIEVMSCDVTMENANFDIMYHYLVTKMICRNPEPINLRYKKVAAWIHFLFSMQEMNPQVKTVIRVNLCMSKSTLYRVFRDAKTFYENELNRDFLIRYGVPID